MLWYKCICVFVYRAQFMCAYYDLRNLILLLYICLFFVFLKIHPDIFYTEQLNLVYIIIINNSDVYQFLQ